MKLHFLGAAREVGRSAILVETDRKMLMDYGLKIKSEDMYPLPLPSKIDLAIMSHGHLDHCGFLPGIYETCTPRTIGTKCTHEFTRLLLEDSIKLSQETHYKMKSYKLALRHMFSVDYNHPFMLGSNSITLTDAGHIPGSSMVEIEHHGKRVFYTGDFKSSNTRLHSPALPPENPPTALVIESTYYNKEHPPRPEVERALYREAIAITESGGTLLLPSFAVGRSQELIAVLRHFDPKMPIFLDGMARKACEIVARNAEFVKDPEGFKKAFSSVTYSRGKPGNKNAMKHPAVIVSTAGMLEGGPALSYLMHLNSESKVVFTGFCLENTNGWRLLNGKPLIIDGAERKFEVPVEYLDFSAHAGRKEVFEFIKKANPEKIFCIHGDEPEKFAAELAEMGFNAYAPTLGERVEV